MEELLGARRGSLEAHVCCGMWGEHGTRQCGTSLQIPNLQPSSLSHLLLALSDPQTVSLERLKVKVLVAQSCPTPCNAMYCSQPGSSVHGILQARILEWVTILSLESFGFFSLSSLATALPHTHPLNLGRRTKGLWECLTPQMS